MHSMSFNWSTDIGEFFFPGLRINNACLLAILCGVLAIVSLIYEGIKVHTAQVRARTAREQIRAVSCAPSETANLLVTEQSGPKGVFGIKFRRLFKEATVFLFHNSIGYALMLSVMLYNGWLFLAVVLSMGLGYFLFGHISMRINMENVQARTTKIVCSPSCPSTEAAAATTSSCSVTDEGGSSKYSSTESSPCRIVPAVATAASYSAPNAILPTISCHQEKIIPLAVNPEYEGDCSCRL